MFFNFYKTKKNIKSNNFINLYIKETKKENKALKSELLYLYKNKLNDPNSIKRINNNFNNQEQIQEK